MKTAIPLHFHELPRAFPDMPMWGARVGPLSLVITHDQQEGWRVSAKLPGSTTHYIGEDHGSFDDAVEACKDFLREKVLHNQ